MVIRGVLSPSTRTSLGHRPKRRAENILAVDPVDFGDADPDDRDLRDAPVEIGARVFVERFAVVDIGRNFIWIENNRRRNDRPSPGSAASFIDPGDRPRSELMLSRLQFE
jgi:hypothetical protein